VGSWGKIPYRLVPGGRAGKELQLLHELSCKSWADLDALKLYLLLIAHRDKTTGCAMIAYTKIEESGGIWRQKIRPAISLLITHYLVRVEQGKTPGQYNTPNGYRILGL